MKVRWFRKAIAVSLAASLPVLPQGPFIFEAFGQVVPLEAAAKPVYVMAPLTDITDWPAFQTQLETLRANGVEGVSTDLWWGKFEKEGEGRYNWDYYVKYADTVRKAGLKWAPILSFHQCGGNVGDDCEVPLPRWIWSKSPDPDHNMKFVDERGFVNDEYVSFWHTDAYAHYDRAMKSFAETFALYSDMISSIHVGLGPTGELRYPSYSFAAGWSYPERGRLQAYSGAAKRDFRSEMRKKYADDLGALNGAWGTSLGSFDEIQPPDDGERFFEQGRQTGFGKDFLGWYQGVLENHFDTMMGLAKKNFGPDFQAELGGKLSGVHWLHDSPSMPHAAEQSAGYVDYQRLMSRFRAAGAGLTFTAMELDDSHASFPPSYSAPQALAKRVSVLARNEGVRIYGENALPIINDEARYRNVGEMLSTQGFSGFTLLRMGHLVDAEGRPTPELAPFVRHVVGRGDKGPESARSALMVPLAAKGPLGAAWLASHFGALTTFFGWAANLTFLYFPWVQIGENLRNMAALKKGGDEAKQASERLAGVSSASQYALVAGNLLNLAPFVASGNWALIANALMGAAGSWIILAQLRSSGHLPGRGIHAAAALSMAAVLFSSALPHPLVTASGLLATAIFCYFPIPQIRGNLAELSVVRREGLESAAGRTALNKLKGIRPKYPIVGLLGNLMLVPIFLRSGHWYNIVGSVFGIAGPLLILLQLASVGLFPKKHWAALSIGSGVFYAAMVWAWYAARAALGGL